MPLDKDKLNSVSTSFKNSTGLLSGIQNVFKPDTSNDSDPQNGALSAALQNKRSKLTMKRGMNQVNSDDDEKMTGIE